MGKPKILVIGGTEEERERLLDEVFERLEVMSRTDLYFSVKSTNDAWETLRLTSLSSFT